MASVAAAIENASAVNVDSDLWWDSHSLLFQALDKTVAGDTALSLAAEECKSSEKESTQDFGQEDALAQKFAENHLWLLNTLKLFKAPNATSFAALKSSRVSVGSHVLEINSNYQDIALRVSTLLGLDEIQAYILTSRVCGSKPALSFMDNNILLSHIMMSYYSERQSVLKSTRLLLICEMAEEGSAARSSQAVSMEVKKLLEDGLEDKMLEVVKEALSLSQPQHLGRDFADLWAEEAALEQTLLLDILFLLYYEPLCICNFARLKDLMNLFEALIIWRSKGEILALTPQTEQLLKHARRKIVLIVIEALDLESLLHMVHSDTPFSQSGYSLSVEDLRHLDLIMAGLDLQRAAECGPVLLSWATFLCLVSFLPQLDGQAALLDMDHTVYVRQAFDAGAHNFLLDMLHDEFFQEFDIQVGGCKSVIKTLVASFLAAYDSVGQMGVDGDEILIDILCEVYHGQEALCLELWDRENVIDGPIRNLLFSLREAFPHQTLSLVRLLAAQCEGTWPAECAYDFLFKMVETTCLYQCDELSLTNESRNMVQTRITLQVPDAPGLLIPAGTSGCILRELAGDVCLVRWECKHSGIVVLLLRMLQRSVSNYQIEEVLAIVDLINRMLSSNKGLTQLFLDLDEAVATATPRADGRMESSLRLDVVSMICSVINALLQNTGDYVVVASCVGILSSFALCCPELVMAQLEQSILLQPSSSYRSLSDGKSFQPTQLHEIIVKTEQSTGNYPLTIAVLDFSRIMVEKGTVVTTDSSASLVMHIIGNLFVNHGNWKYQQWRERWMITTKVIWIMRSIVSSIIRTREITFLKGALELIVHDCAVHDVLIDVLSINAQELEELLFSRAVGLKEVEWLQQAIYAVLMLLHDLVLDVTLGVCSKDYGGVTLLEQTLYRKATGSLAVVTAIASFLSFSRNTDLQYASAKALTSLFLLAQKSRPHPSSIASYISSNEKVAMRTAIGELLSEDTAVSNCLLFEAVIDLLTAAVRWQPALVEHLLFPMEHSPVPGSTLEHDSAGSSSTNAGSVTIGLDALWRLITKSQMINNQPRALSRVLFLLASIWEGGIEYLRVIDALRSKNDFWMQLTSCLSFSNVSSSPPTTLLSKIKASLDPERPLLAGLSDDELVAFSFLYACEASVLSIMARDIFLQHLVRMEVSNFTSAGGSDSGSRHPQSNGAGKVDETSVSSKLKFTSTKSGALPIVLEWCKNSQMNSIMSSYTLCLYDKEVLLRAKVEARVLVVGLMGKILSGDSRGLNVSLARRVREAATQINQHPSFEELSEQYSSRGYSYGDQLQVMLISDLFHHLQGELDGGRPIPSGAFQHVAGFVVRNEMDTLLNSIVANQLPDLHPAYGYNLMYDTVALESELGLEWWGQADFGIVTTPVAESTLRSTRHANSMASLGNSQLSALKSWVALLTVSIFNKQEARNTLTFTDSGWSEGNLKSYTLELCSALEGMLKTIGPLGDMTNFTPGFMTSQVHLLIVFIRWLSSLGASILQKPYIWSICTNLIHTVLHCLEKLMDTQCFLHQQIKELVKSFLGALLLLLELMHSQKSLVEDESHGPGEATTQYIREAFADVSLVGLGCLPLLCHAVEKNDYANMAIAVINILIQSFLAPSTWFPVLQKDFPLAISLSRMHDDSQGADSFKVMLNFCLAFVRLKGGAELLHSAGFFSQLQTISHQLREEVSLPLGDMQGPFSVQRKNSRESRGLWSLSIAVVAGLVRSLGDKDPSGTVLKNTMTYIQLQKDCMVGALRAPTTLMDMQGRKKVKMQQPGTTLAALQDTQHVVSLMCEVSHHHVPWTLKDSLSDFGEVVVHLLAFIAREGLVCSGSSIRISTGAGFNCQPLQKDEIVAHSKPAMINSSCAWFAVTARGCATGESAQVVRSQSPSRTMSQSLTLSPSRRAGSLSPVSNFSAPGGVGVSPSQYSNMVAIHIYKLAFLLLRYLCQEAHHATGRVERGIPEYSNFPELPAPEILHGLQDQIVAVVTEVCGKSLDRTANDVCLLLLSILEMTLYLEVCLAKTCGVVPAPLRSEDFGKEFKAMLLAAHLHGSLELALQSLKRIMSTAHPGLI